MTCPSADDIAGVCREEMPNGPLVLLSRPMHQDGTPESDKLKMDAMCNNPCTAAVELAKSSRCIENPAGRDVTRLTGVPEPIWTSVAAMCHKNDLRVAQDVHVEPPEPVSAVAKCGEISTSVIPHIQSLCCVEVPMPEEAKDPHYDTLFQPTWSLEPGVCPTCGARTVDGPVCAYTRGCTAACSGALTAYVQSCADYLSSAFPDMMHSLFALGHVCEQESEAGPGLASELAGGGH